MSKEIDIDALAEAWKVFADQMRSAIVATLAANLKARIEAMKQTT